MALVPRRWPGWVYFAASEFADAVKIGFSISPWERVDAIDATSAVPVTLVCVMRGTLRTERALHRKFARYHERFEWFRFAPEIREFIASRLRDGRAVVMPDPRAQRRTSRHAANRFVPRFGVIKKAG